ncbi:MAG: FAD-dependent oxidoreductase [Legionella sp.]|nr:FAD-dependent oxidoreductase [Legionella sp.]
MNQIKIARHTGGTFLPDPYLNSKRMDDEEFLSIKHFISEHLTKVSSEVVKQENCLYDLTPDKQFIIDLHPEYSQIAFATGLSGHGYKMSNVIGDILVDLVTQKTLEFDISFLSLKRFQSTKFEI